MLFPTSGGYDPRMDVRETEAAIKEIKDFFERSLASSLNLTRVSAPLFVRPESGLNDNLSGVERPVSFDVKGAGGCNVEIVQSLAKWKRYALKRYGFGVGEGLYTDMNAIRRDEVLDNLHSVYVDQWDWEKVISKDGRNEETIKDAVLKIYGVFKEVERFVGVRYPFLPPVLPAEITFISAQELEDMYPGLESKERENAICKKRGAVFLTGIGAKLKSGTPHDGRAPDYDDWSLNGDLLFWYPVLNCAMELSSMGVRVDSETLVSQLRLSGCEDRLNFDFHRRVAENDLPFTMGGGLGQSRICMFLLRRAHIGEVQASIWPDDMARQCADNNIKLL